MMEYYFVIWSGNHYIWLRLGDGLIVTDGVLDVKPPLPIPAMTLGVMLVWDASVGGYRLPVIPTQLAVYVNGLRYAEGIDYTLTEDLIIPIATNWPDPANTVVLVDYR